jgi:superfamily II DNA or RNA helicase
MTQKDFVGRYKHIIMDECHGGKEFSSQINKILNDYGSNCYVKIGMTGTFPKDPCDMRTLHCAMGPIRYEISAKQLMDIGWLAEMNLTTLCLNEDFKKEHNAYNSALPVDEKKLTYLEFKKTLFPEYAHEMAYLVANTERNNVIAEFVKLKVDTTGNGIILVNSVKQGKILEELIPSSKFIYGDDKTKTRKEMFSLFSTEDNVVMITTYKLAAVGLNIKRIFNIFMLDSGKSFIRVIQTIGRGFRKDYDKTSVNVYDIYGNIIHTDRHARERIKFYTSEGHEINHTLKINYR